MPVKPLVAALILLSTTAAQADLPGPVATARAENAAACRAAGGSPSEKNGYLVERDLNGDGTPDYAMNLMALDCAGAAGYFCGSAGCPVTVWVSQAGSHRVAWSSYAQDVQWQGNTLIASLHGQFCQPPKPGFDGCEERVAFDAPSPAAPDPAPAATASPDPTAPAPDRWALRTPAGVPPVAVVGGPGNLRSLAAFCLQGQPWLAMVFEMPPAQDDIRVDFLFSTGTLWGPAQRQATTGGAFVIGLANSPLVSQLAGRDASVGLAVDGAPVGTVSLVGSTGALRGALGPCLRF